MKLYNLTMKNIITASTTAEASNAQFFDIKYVFEKLGSENPFGVKNYGEAYWTFYQKELKELASEIKAITGTKMSKAKIFSLLEEMSAETGKMQYMMDEERRLKRNG